MGAVSPIAIALNGGLPFDGVCPTAGTIVKGMTSTRGRAMCSSAFRPRREAGNLSGRASRGWKARRPSISSIMIAQAGERRGSKVCLALRELLQLASDLPLLLEEGFRHLKPVFGYIPARHGRTGKNAARGLLCLGTRGRQSPLTFCGFGSFVRHIGRVAMLLDFALRHELLEEKHLRLIGPHQANLRIAWVFSRFMQTWPGADDAAVNRIMNVFCMALGEIGQSTTLRFLQDRYTLGEYLRIMLTTAKHYPEVLLLAVQVLGPVGVIKWMGDLAYFAGNEVFRLAYKANNKAWVRAERLAQKKSQLRRCA